MASPDSASQSSLANEHKDVMSRKQALFRPPSVETSDVTVTSKVQDTSDTEVFEVDELQQDTKDWMEENVEIVD